MSAEHKEITLLGNVITTTTDDEVQGAFENQDP